MLANRDEVMGKMRKGTHGVLLAVPTNPPTAHAMRLLRRPGVLVWPACPCSPPAFDCQMATRRLGQDARQNSSRAEMGKRAGRDLRNATAHAPLDLCACQSSFRLVLATLAEIPEDGVARAAHIVIAVPA